MTNEQREAVDRLNKDKNKPLACGDITTCFIDDLDTVLSLLEQKDKQIDLMAEYIADISDCPAEIFNVNLACASRCNASIDKECWIKYFENKVKEDNINE